MNLKIIISLHATKVTQLANPCQWQKAPTETKAPIFHMNYHEFLSATKRFSAKSLSAITVFERKSLSAVTVFTEAKPRPT